MSETAARPSAFDVALIGNPNVGKSTVFNRLTGMRQHTGNWPGKTVEVATGRYIYGEHSYVLTDLPGTYSLLAHSPEEEVTRNHLCLTQPDCAVVVCDASSILRGMNLVLQTIELTPRVVLCVNLMDEARKQGNLPDLAQLSSNLGIPVVGTEARNARGLNRLKAAIAAVCRNAPTPAEIRYTDAIERAVAPLTEAVRASVDGISARWLGLRLLEEGMTTELLRLLSLPTDTAQALLQLAQQQRNALSEEGIPTERLCEMLVSCLLLRSEEMCFDCIDIPPTPPLRPDPLLAHKWLGVLWMLLLFFGVFWITIEGANLPSELLSEGFARLEALLNRAMTALGTSEQLRSLVCDGIFRVLAWVVAVMLPPMAIFFPLFTLLEDWGILPRIAFLLDGGFKKACSCGKQALTMCMGLGCNAVGVTGCRIIDSPHERVVAILTNAFTPCNGRFPALITLLTLLCASSGSLALSSAVGAAGLTFLLAFSFGTTLLWSRILSKTVLKGLPSSFALELPPYRTPQWGKVLVRSLLDRTLFVLGRAAAVAVPAGACIWVLTNIDFGGASLLCHMTDFLEPIGRFFGMDGVILAAFLLGSPANEIVLPLMLLGYSGGTSLQEVAVNELGTLLTANGWTPLTAVCTLLFMLLHWPCATTCLTIYKETHSIRKTATAVLLPTATGLLLCAVIAAIYRLC